MNKDAHFDAHAFNALQEIMEEDFPVLVAAFVADSEPRIPALKYALRYEDFNALRDISHCFKGAAGNLSAFVLERLCLSIEQQSRARSVESIGRITVFIEQIEDEFKAVKSILLDIIQVDSID